MSIDTANGYGALIRQHPQFRVLWFGHTMLNLGEVLKALALAVLIYNRTGSPLLSAIAFVSGYLPQLLGSAVLLSLTDYLPPRTVLVGYELLRAGGAALLASNLLPVGGMLALALLFGFFDPVPAAMKSALLTDILDVGDRYLLGQSLFNITVGTVQITGFAVGGVLLGWLAPDDLLWLVAGLAVISAAVLGLGMSDWPPRAPAGRTRSPWAGVSATWARNRQLLGDRRIRRLIAALCVPPGWIVGGEAIMTPYAAEVGQARMAGTILAASALGMLVGDVLAGRLIPAPSRQQFALPLALLLGLPYLLFFTRPSEALAAVLAGLAAVGFGYNLCLQVPFLRSVPADQRGQAMGLSTAAIMSCQGGSAAFAGWLADVWRPSAAIGCVACLSLLCSLLLVRPVAQGVQPGEPDAVVPGNQESAG